MSIPEPRAVFISYSSDDVEAAQRIASALIAAGIEVWFDRSELRGGDTWDQNIRRQIRECALFLPIVSATTERRPEGYFRLEWRLADQRTHHMGRTKAFIVPACIDETDQDTADVPDSFLAAHWTRLPGGNPTPEFVERVGALLSGTAATDAGRSRPAFPVRSAPPLETHEAPHRRLSTRTRWLIRLGIVAVLLVISIFFFNAGLLVGIRHPELAPVEKTIAVLQFDEIGGDPAASTGLPEGIQTDIISRLARVPDLVVTPGISVAKYRDTTKSAPEIATELGVNYILTGSIQRDASTLHVNVYLIDTKLNSTIWTKDYAPEITNRFAMQATLAEAIATALDSKLTEADKKLLASKATSNSNALSTYRAVLESFNEDVPTRAWLQKQEDQLTASVRMDADFAEAWGLLAVVHSLYVSNGFDTTDERKADAKQAIDKAVQLQPDLPEVIRSQGIYLSEVEHDYPGAIVQFQKLGERLSARADAFGYLGTVYRHQGRWDEALKNLRDATDLDSLSLVHHRTLEKVLADVRQFLSARMVRNTILSLLTPGSTGRSSRGGGPGGQLPIPLLAERPEESYQAALLMLRGFGSRTEGDALIAGLTPVQSAAPRFIALRTDWARVTGDLDQAIQLDRQQPGYIEEGTPTWNQTINIASVFAARDDKDGARARIGNATTLIQARIVDDPDNAKLYSWLGLAEALLGNREEALTAGQKAVTLSPVEVDAVSAASARLRLALIQSWLGDMDPAVASIATLLRTPGFEATTHSMKLDPWFAALRKDPRFMALLSDPKNNDSFYPDPGGRGGRGGPVGLGNGRGGVPPDGGGRGQGPPPGGGGFNRGNGGDQRGGGFQGGAGGGQGRGANGGNRGAPPTSQPAP